MQVMQGMQRLQKGSGGVRSCSCERAPQALSSGAGWGGHLVHRAASRQHDATSATLLPRSVHHEVEVPHVHHHAPHGGGWLDRMLPIAAMIVALSSLGIAVYEARATREFHKASVWPYLSAYHSYAGDSYTYSVANAGVGPALVRSLEIFIDGKAQPNWGSVARTLLGSDARLAGSVYSSFGHGSVLLSNGKTVLLQLPPGEETARFASAIEPRLNVRLCYCSLFEDCWVLDERQSDEPHPVAPDRCEGPKAIEFAR